MGVTLARRGSVLSALTIRSVLAHYMLRPPHAWNCIMIFIITYDGKTIDKDRILLNISIGEL